MELLSTLSIWEWVLAGCAGLTFYAYLGYPILLAAVAAFSNRETPKTGYFPTMSLVIAAYNEERSIHERLVNACSLEYPEGKLEIVVASDGSNDRTAEIVAAFPDPRVRLLDLRRRAGKTVTQNEAVEQCKGDILVFSDATTEYDRKALAYIAANYADPKVGAVSGRYDYTKPGQRVAPPTATWLGSFAFWNYENMIKTFQSRIATLTGASGCIYSIRRDLYVPLPADACSDIVEPLEIVRQGYRVAFEPRAQAYETATENVGSEFRMRVRVAGHGIHAVYLERELLNVFRHGWVSFQLFSHKILRWAVGLWMVLFYMATAMLLGRPWAQWLFALQTLFYMAAVAGWLMPRRQKLLSLPLYFCTMYLAVFVSLWRLLRGKHSQVWHTART